MNHETEKHYKNTPAGRAVAQKYADILNLSRPTPSYKHPRMSLSNRAKIFSPFAALRGYDEEIRSEVLQLQLITKPELRDEDKEKLSDKLLQIRKGMEVTVSYFDPENGYKVTEYLEGSHCCDPENWEEVDQCMAFLRKFHQKDLAVEHTFDIFERIDFYQKLWNGQASCYRDYQETLEGVQRLRPYIDSQPKRWTLCHIDAVPDNFLIREMPEGTDIHLIDWEYSGMQDADVDIAMFAIYALYEKEQVDRLIDGYYPEGISREHRLKIYCYVAACGLLWSNWCEFKRQQGVEFGEYSLRQYRYAKEFARYVEKEIPLWPSGQE